MPHTPLSDLGQDPLLVPRPVRGLQARNRLADHLRRGIAEHPLRPAVPAHHPALQVLPYDRIVRRLDARRQESQPVLVALDLAGNPARHQYHHGLRHPQKGQRHHRLGPIDRPAGDEILCHKHSAGEDHRPTAAQHHRGPNPARDCLASTKTSFCFASRATPHYPRRQQVSSPYAALMTAHLHNRTALHYAHLGFAHFSRKGKRIPSWRRQARPAPGLTCLDV